jgi:hypothetical protein
LLSAAFLVSPLNVPAQSLRPDDPAPLKPGINKGTAENTNGGTQYWYFLGQPGENRIVARFRSTGSGNVLFPSITITVYDEKRTWRTSRTLTAEKNSSVFGDAQAHSAAETQMAGNLDKAQKIIISVAPPSGGLLREGGEYELEVSGAAQFDKEKSGDPIIGAFASAGTIGATDWGAVRFLAAGTIETSNGYHGRWKVFDPEHHLYSVEIGGIQLSLRYLPARGLVDSADETKLWFKQVR